MSLISLLHWAPQLIRLLWTKETKVWPTLVINACLRKKYRDIENWIYFGDTIRYGTSKIDIENCISIQRVITVSFLSITSKALISINRVQIRKNLPDQSTGQLSCRTAPFKKQSLPFTWNFLTADKFIELHLGNSVLEYVMSSASGSGVEAVCGE